MYQVLLYVLRNSVEQSKVPIHMSMTDSSFLLRYLLPHPANYTIYKHLNISENKQGFEQE